MDYKDYNSHKQKIINLFEETKKRFPDWDFSTLNARIKNLEEGRFTLAVVGEVKAGKSTFLNALLGAEILPSDVLQATSAIIEIFKAEKEFLEVEYANGQVKRVYDDPATPNVNEALEFLKKISSVSEEYRDIPIIQLNNFLLEKTEFGKKNLKIGKNTINEFLGKLKKEHNIHNLPANEYEKKIESYLKEKSKEAGMLPLRITFGYPLKFDFDGFRIVDTPGVNACGGIEDLTIEYINKADALVYVTPIKPIESKFFKEFVQNSLREKSKNSLLLVLTHAGLFTSIERERLLGEGRKIYCEIKEENILAVDSILKKFLGQLRGQNCESIIDQINTNEKMETVLAKYSKYLYRKEEKTFWREAEAGTGFHDAQERLVVLSKDAIQIQFHNFLNPLMNAFYTKEKEYLTQLSDIKSALGTPQKFEEEYKIVKDELSAFVLTKNRFVDELESEFEVKTGSKKEDEISAFIQKNRFLIEKFLDGQIEMEKVKTNVKSFLAKIQGDVNDKISDILEDLKSGIDKKLRDQPVIIDSRSINIALPEVDLSYVWDKAIKVEEVDKKIVGTRTVGLAATGAAAGSFFPVVGTGIGAAIGGFLGFIGDAMAASDNDEKEKQATLKALKKYREKVREEVNSALNKISVGMENTVNSTIKNYLELYSKEMDLLIAQRKERLDLLDNDKNNRIVMENSLNQLEEKCKCLESLFKEFKSLGANL